MLTRWFHAARRAAGAARPRVAVPTRRRPRRREGIALLFLGATTIATFLGCGPADPPRVSDGAGPSDYDTNIEQAETAVAAGTTLVVAGYNDFSVGYVPLCGGTYCIQTPEISFQPSFADPQTRTIVRHVSLMGWATSGDAGQTWLYRGKVRPPTNWSAIWGDPDVATDPNNRSKVYFSQMGVTDAAWDSVSGGADTTTASPAAMVDGFCVARSTDSGASFPNVKCVHVSTPGNVDHTTVTVDGTGRVWVATVHIINFQYHMEAWHSSSAAAWDDFQKAPDPPYYSVTEPLLTTGSNGEVWLTGISGSQIASQQWSEGAWTNQVIWNNLCGITAKQGDAVIGSGQVIRDAHSFDIGVGLNEHGEYAIRLLYQRLKPNGMVGLGGLQFTNQHGCQVPDGWNTDAVAGQQFMGSPRGLVGA